jgi:hypothetical protein
VWCDQFIAASHACAIPKTNAIVPDVLTGFPGAEANCGVASILARNHSTSPGAYYSLIPFFSTKPFNASTFRKSSPGSLTGVSAINVACRKR